MRVFELEVGIVSKKLCRFNRRDIADSLGAIHSLVIESKYLCRSCARSSIDKESLCKPAAIPPKECQEKSTLQASQCALLEESRMNLKQERALTEKADKPKTTSKKLKKALKQQKQYNKKLNKILKKQRQLAKKQNKVEKQLSNIASLSNKDELLVDRQVHLH